ncbi:ribosome assembly cofactor RimP [Mesohalobacter halotolerans]|uniref:Ribosome maturation factor RimP n=1 Tax=Mesohalobacter halotolerans TaxID=1883405 RepID=A0A4U5TPK2_9FLAO|nr:ribosome assembly cofactor RimP [Mesohalobacter halotolerans]TKS55913.1 ribosome assembly cofactor RimP [Mesohalobacter halotolerans]
MQAKAIIEQTISKILEERSDLFVINQHISDALDINLTIDGEDLVNISDCIEISRKIESALDRDLYDFSIKVQSPGADEPLVDKRQYKKHIGRKVKLKTDSQYVEGRLVEVDDDQIRLTWKSREKKPKGKGKMTVKYDKTFAFTEIKEASIKLMFNKN